jgi:hypothetical protein
MKKLPVVLFVVLATMLSARSAQAFGIGADLGYSRLLDDGQQSGGVGGDLYLRLLPIPVPLVDVELQAGFHRFQFDGLVKPTLDLVPLFVGARLNLPIPGVKVFLGAHVGAMYQNAKVPFGDVDLGSSRTDFAANLGAGVTLLDLPLLKLGVSAWFYAVNDDRRTTMGTVGLNADFGL